MSKTATINTLVVLAVLVFFAMVIKSESVDTNRQVSSRATTGSGTSILAKVKSGAYDESVMTLGKPLLEPESLYSVDTLIITSPFRTVSEIESQTIKDFVERGGFLFLSFHNEQTRLRLSGLMADLSITDGEVVDNDAYQNGKAQSVVASSEQWLFDEGTRYTVYSPVRYADCNTASTDCFHSTHRVGEGFVVVNLGLPLFSNAMLTQSNNVEYAVKFLTMTGVIGFDEYHLFYSSKTGWDLISLPAFAMPMMGLILILIAFAFFGPKLDLTPRYVVQQKPEGYHDINAGLIRNLVPRTLPSSESLISGNLQRRYPDQFRTEKREFTGDPVGYLEPLFAQHRRILKERGKIK